MNEIFKTNVKYFCSILIESQRFSFKPFTMESNRELGNHRSNYGLKTYTPEETKNQWKQMVEKQRVIHENHAGASSERKSIEQAKEGHLPQKTYFNNGKKHPIPSAYDRQFHIEQNYHCKLKRDDRMAALGLNINAEEKQKKIPILSSTSYGQRKMLEKPDRKHCRVALVRRDFYRGCGTNIPLTQDTEMIE